VSAHLRHADVTAASAFLLTVYPDLVDTPLSLAVKRERGTLIVSVRPGTVGSESGVDGVRPPPLLGAVFAFTAAGDLQSFVAEGPLVDGARSGVFRQTLAEHPAWTSADAEVSLVALGGRAAGTDPGFTPVDPARVTAFIGTQARADAPQLQLVASQTDTARPTASPGWVAHVQAVGRDGQPASYLFQYEPFTGRLVAAVRQ
jgi:hypothetical protein